MFFKYRQEINADNILYKNYLIYYNVKGKTKYNWETHDNQDKVIVDSINAIERRREHMTDEQLRKAYTELQTGLGPDIYSQLCDRKASDNFQG